MEVDTYEEYQLMVGFTQDSANKYRTASDCCNRAMYLLVTAIRQSYSQLTVGQLCAIGDRLAREQLARVYTRNNKSSLSNFSNDLKGVAYPTCISANHLAGGYSPLEETAIYLQPGDLIKIEMAVHIDGHIASMAHTMLVGTIDRPLTGPLANAVCAAYHASELLCQSLHVGVQSDYLLRLAQQVAADFHCQLMEGPLVTRMERFLLESPMKCLRHSLDPQTAAQQQPFTVEPFEVYCVSVVMTTGPTGKVISVMNGVSGAAEQAITVYQRDVNRTYNLRTKSGRALLSVVTNRLGVFPFSLRDLTEEGKEKEEQDDELSTINDANGSGNLLRLGMRECLDSGQLTGWPAMADKRGSWTAQFRHTCIVQDQQTTRITNTSHLPLPYVHSEFSLSPTTESNGGSKIFKNASFNPASIPPAAVSMEI